MAPLSFDLPEDAFAIYNNGVPSLVLTTEQDIYDILHGIEDPLECFPPDAQEAAELEACEAFVETMAMLALLEEAEEQARHHFGHIRKRWEVRRQRGLIGRPKPAQHSVRIKPHQHHLARYAVQERSLIKTSPAYWHKNMTFAPLPVKPTTARLPPVIHRPIQQPRKHS
ncbi:hypothetical protein FisN_31Hh048 [Fistulifera solaris]|uniref:Uncharacterized protein n=1 Tax=Fistulifera solaris TaxID=1519565 RepID=A0A1Z5JAQ6_FISSO|nr:hypothetical protein FisN_31Hh048 [Fistulifera solaris]|eukprot:GAX10841.1 hypothetical protein FisN_31Hh048 [Fistulifera solaris]